MMWMMTSPLQALILASGRGRAVTPETPKGSRDRMVGGKGGGGKDGMKKGVSGRGLVGMEGMVE